MQKVKTDRDEKYLAYIRTLPCLDCGWPADVMGKKLIEAHHIETGGTSIKCSDYLTVPLCNAMARGCHPRADKSKNSAELYRPYAERMHEVYIKLTSKGYKP